jgi:type IV secretion system protein VirD4
MKRTHFILDEAASLGHLEAVDDAVDKYRGYGVRLQFYFQSLGQLKKCFPEGQEQTLLSNTTQIYFGVNDNQTAEQVSSRLGESTIIVESGGRSSGNSSNWSSSQQGAQHGSSGSDNSSSNWAQQARKLLKPEEILTLDPRLAITFTPNVRPILTRLARYYEEPKLGRRSGWIKRSFTACSILVASAAFCIVSLGAAAFLTLEVKQIAKTRGIQGAFWRELPAIDQWQPGGPAFNGSRSR